MAADWVGYKDQRNKAVSLIRSKKRLYFENLIDRNKANSRKMWQGIKRVMGKRKGEIIQAVYFNDILVEDDKSLADSFNNYFVQSIELLIANRDKHHDLNQRNHVIMDNQITSLYNF